MPLGEGDAACELGPSWGTCRGFPVDRGFGGNPDLDYCSLLPSMQSVFRENKQPGPDALVKLLRSCELV